ncbi:serine/threonine-protein kinase RsbW [Geodermatophilus amargosae]|uniref:Serine/threonine-protein kinase RsbW n=1 Tax=Geodermatophilus amargosae TaxID=1296565 RepID=A0A1I7C6Y2_9ACTN|nr:ATP-binding protein [Geodermatophilus amargosae]SFT95179.1 serine/threonine-protein kinase RsbW [Geodermatophilus amargosae]
MDISFTVRLPVDVSSVPFVRGLCRQALEHLQVDRPVIEETTLALTEACANVVQHSGEHAEYEVSVTIHDDLCRITVVDDGTGSDRAEAAARSDPDGDGGAGLRLMQALVDSLDFRRDAEGRHRMSLEKRLSSRPPLRLLGHS